MGMKALQNVTGCYFGLQLLEQSLNQNTEVAHYISSAAIFQYSIIRYAKPFTNSEFEGKSFIYPTKHLLKTEGFSSDTHDHLIRLRNTLIAHDDHDELESKMLTLGAHFHSQTTDEIVAVIAHTMLANKCISHLANRDHLKLLLVHTEATLLGIKTKLDIDLTVQKELAVEYPAINLEHAKYIKQYGSPILGEVMSLPDISSDEWLNANEPKFTVHENGYVYEKSIYKIDFDLPTIVKSASGEVLGNFQALKNENKLS